jgi:hypothetical protein
MNDAGEADDASSNSIKEALALVFADKRIYLFILLQHTSLLSQNFQYFFPTIVKTLGYGNIETLLITAPVWIATFIVSLIVTYTSGKTNDRSLHIICLMLVSVVGGIICTATTNTGAKFFAMFLYVPTHIPISFASLTILVCLWELYPHTKSSLPGLPTLSPDLWSNVLLQLPLPICWVTQLQSTVVTCGRLRPVLDIFLVAVRLLQLRCWLP